MRPLLATHFFLCLALVPGCERATPSLTPDELAANWEKHKGQTVVLSGSPKIIGKQLALFYETGGNYRIKAEVAEGSEKLKPGQRQGQGSRSKDNRRGELQIATLSG
jgi:hypothetical protein